MIEGSVWLTLRRKFETLPKAIIIKMDKKVLILWLFLKAGGHIMQMFYGGTGPF